jgi:vacuolar-type H+-ATPase subunit E/Vma4
MTIEKDIVKVLRTMRPSIIPDLWTSILNEAADEIEKLRKAARNILNGIETGAVRIETEQDETWANALRELRAAIRKVDEW